MTQTMYDSDDHFKGNKQQIKTIRHPQIHMNYQENLKMICKEQSDQIEE